MYITHLHPFSEINDKDARLEKLKGRREKEREVERERVMVGVRTNYLPARCTGEDGVTNFTLTPGRPSHHWPVL